MNTEFYSTYTECACRSLDKRKEPAKPEPKKDIEELD